MKSARIAGLGKCLPPNVLTNADLEKKVDTSDEWIITRTGIRERRIVKAGESASDLAREASLQALKRAGIKAKDLDLIIVATITPDTQFPATACHLQNAIKATNAICFDISAACAGFVYALNTAWQFIKGGLYEKILIVGSEVLSSITDWEDRSTCVLFGDGAGAAVLLPTTSDKGVLSSYMGSDGSQTDILIVPGGGSRCPASIDTLKKKLHYIKMRGNELFRIAVRVMAEAAEKAITNVGLQTSDIDILVPHQANKRIIDAVAQRLKIPREKVYMNVDRYGNMSSASSAVALCEAWEKGEIKDGDLVVLDAFGAGLVWGSCVIRWV
ncbi:MAG: beta-ketoacyl-ACP synthase III [Candidatus Omnitrophica bacterium]|nr:beta-ketoacyl-ACP synthase III [Candidatus Omnitrophota bacterium]MBD3269690.1 beta-ketoacyl-ACP synthase III [Candidatus Omnitrophota bacterium]